MSENGKQHKEEVDRLERIVSTKEELVEVEGRTLKVTKWNLKQSLRMSVHLGKLVRNVIKEIPTPKKEGDSADFVASLLKADLADIVESQYDNIVLIMSETLVRGNFDTLGDARKWVEDCGSEGLEIITIIARQNIRPLVKAISGAVADARKIAEARRASA